MKTIELHSDVGSRALKVLPWEEGCTAFNPGEFGVYADGWPRPGMWCLVDVIHFDKQKRQNEIPRRIRMDLFIPAETAIMEAMKAVEATGASKSLTDAVVLLQQARDKVADYVDLKL